MYDLQKSLNLVTVASNLNENLAISNTDNSLFSDNIAVIHSGCVNVIPLITGKDTRAKYLPIKLGKDRGLGFVKQVRWLQLDIQKIFVVASTAGIQIYDEELRDVKFHHACNETGDGASYINGICVLHGNLVCVGTHLGNIWMFKYDEVDDKYELYTRIFGHDEAITGLDGVGNKFISCSEKVIYMWAAMLPLSQYDIVRKLHVPGLYSSSTSIKFCEEYIFVGYDSGEFCVFNVYNEQYLVRMVAHRLKVSAIDFACDANYILTASMDCYIKLWKFAEKEIEVVVFECLQAITNEEGPICGARFLNGIGAEFCIATEDSLVVNCYFKNKPVLETENIEEEYDLVDGSS